MHEDITEDIYKDRIDYAMISLIADKIKIGVIGSGRAGIIKAKHFTEQNCNVFMITKDTNINEDIKNLTSFHNFNISYDEYSNSFIMDKHLIIIAVNDDTLRDNIKAECEKYAKIYIDCSEFKKGLAVVPVQRNTKNIVVGVNTKGGNPKASVFIADKINKNISIYDEYIGFTTKIRNKVKNNKRIKKEVIDFISSEDFYYFFKKNKAEEILELFYSEVHNSGNNNCD